MGELADLRVPFPPESVGKLPRVTCKDCSDRNTQCSKHQRSKCNVCGNYITAAHIHLDFVGHAGVTDRLLKVDPQWTWEPVAFDDQGAPLIQRQGQEARMWIRLTVLGVTRLGVGIASGFELEKQLISDAIRNAAMRFGVALDLWSKEDLLPHYDATTERTEEPPANVDAATGEVDVPKGPPIPSEAVDAMKPREVVAALLSRGEDAAGTPDELRERLRELVSA